MKKSVPTFQMGWLDLGEEGQRRANEYLAQFKADNTVDELGFGILRDAFADIFYPATNTIMTRTRYLIFIPAICRLIEQEKLSGRAATSRLKELEDQLREALLNQESEGGVIGAVAGEALRRYPSNIYWNSLKRLGIFLLSDWGLGYYQDHLARLYSAMTAEKDDDGLSHLAGVEQRTWDRAFCTLLDEDHMISLTNKAFSSSLSFNLTKSEAQYLKGKFLLMADRKGRVSLMSHLLELKYPDSFRYPWDVPCPKELESYVKHARCFSMFAQGVTLQYFHLLVQKRKKSLNDLPECELTDLFSRWWESTRSDLAGWNIDEFLQLATELGGIRHSVDATFINAWLNINNEALNPQTMLTNSRAHDLICKRERATRPNKSRLFHPDYLLRWTPPEQSEVDSMCNDPDRLRFRLNYRSSIGSIFVQDIVNGLLKGRH